MAKCCEICGKEYNIDGILKFEDEYLNLVKNRKRKRFSSNGKLVYKFEYFKKKIKQNYIGLCINF